MYKCTHEITVYDTCGVYILQATEDLVEEVLDELFLERARGEKTVEIGAQKLGDKVARGRSEDEDGRQGMDAHVL